MPDADETPIPSPKAAVLARLEAERLAWNELVDAVGRDRMDEPGPMGEWTFRDLVTHLLGWRERTIARLEAASQGEPDPPPFWPAEIRDDDDDDSINAWIREQAAGRSIDDVLEAADESYRRMAGAIARMPDSMITDRHFEWLDGGTLAEGDLLGHLHDEHEPSIRAWMASRGPAQART